MIPLNAVAIIPADIALGRRLQGNAHKSSYRPIDLIVTPAQLPRLDILVVDDEEANRRFLEKALVRHGHRVTLAASGEEAFKCYMDAEPDLVLMDVMMPGWDGYETTRRIRAGGGVKGCWVPLIFLSALDRTPDIVRGLAAGGDDYITKPVDLALLESKIAAMQRIAALQRQLERNNTELASYYRENEERKQEAAELFGRLMRHDRLPPGGQIRVRVVSADNFSGDLAGAARSADGHDYLMLADAAGHGLTAAINVLPAVDCFYALADQGYSLARIAATINSRLRQLLPVDHFVAILLARVDVPRGEIEVLNAGMPAALLLDAGGGLLGQFASQHFPLGVDDAEESDFVVASMPAPPGAQLFACSDGLLEATDEEGRAFGEDRLLATLADTPAAVRFDAALSAVDRFRNGHPAHDDVSLAQLTVPDFAVPPAPTFGEGALEDGEAENFQMTLGPNSLRNPDLVPAIIGMTSEVLHMTESSRRAMAVLLTELVGNSLDYGLLAMTPRHTAPDRGAWRAERSRRLLGLASGRIRISLQRTDWQGTPAWCLEVTDTGAGFLQGTPPAQGGIERSRQRCLALRFNESGNVATGWFC